MSYVVLCLLAVPPAAMVRAVFRRYGMVGFGTAWVTIVLSFALFGLLLPGHLLLGAVLSLALAMVVVGVLGAKGVLREV
jgi:O-antigen/teichoic acid export membrane protein